jgi:ribosomal protein S18 acetylase RimI-like enzyme
MDATGDRGAVHSGHVELIAPRHTEPLIAFFERNAVPAVEGTFDPFPLSAKQARAIASRTGKDLYYALLLAGAMVGFSMLRGFDEGYEEPSFGIFVDHHHQGEGLGRRLTSWTIEQAWSIDCPAVRLSVYSHNKAAKRIYDSLGFIEMQRSPIMHAGKSTEKIVMRLERNAR